jgi:magnesium transporter
MDPRATATAPPPPPEQSVVRSAIYRNGHRIESPVSLAETYQRLREQPGTMAWIGLYRPAEAQLLTVAEEFGLHKLAVEDAIVAHQRPKLERYGDTLFVVLRSARYLDDVEEVDFGEIHIFVGTNFVLTVRHGQSGELAGVRRRLESDPDLLRRGPEAVLYAILDAVVDGYAPVVAGLQHDIDEIETEVFRGDPKVSRRIYELSREVIEFQRATRPLLDILAGLAAGFDKYGIDDELRAYLADVADHVTTAAERVDSFRQMLADILTLNATLVSQGGHPVCAHPDRHRVRHELRSPARTALAGRLCLRARPHGGGLRRPVRDIQATWLAVTKPARQVGRVSAGVRRRR